MPNVYSVFVYDQDGFPFSKSESVLVRQEDQDGQVFLIISNLKGDKLIRLRINSGQPRFSDSYKAPFVTYKLLNNFTITIKAVN